MDRSFVRYRDDRFPQPPPRIRRFLGKEAGPEGTPRVSIIIPTADGSREGYLPALLEQIQAQTLQDYELFVVEGDHRQGRAINAAAARARAEVLVTFDDDTRLVGDRVLERLVEGIRSDPSIGMAGGANLLPDDAPPLVRRVMAEIPRRSSPPVERVTDSDLAEHPCLALRREVFLEVGGENEWIPRGLDPYLREQVRRAGYRVVVLPGVAYHHLPPSTLPRLLRQFFRNGVQSRFCAQLYPQWVYETAEEHGPGFVARRTLPRRALRLAGQVLGALFSGRWVLLACRTAYALGWLWQAVRGCLPGGGADPATPKAQGR